MPRPRKPKPNLEVKAITLNSPDLIAACLCDIKGYCRCLMTTKEEDQRLTEIASKDNVEKVLRRPRS